MLHHLMLHDLLFVVTRNEARFHSRSEMCRDCCLESFNDEIPGLLMILLLVACCVVANDTDFYAVM